MTQPDWDDERLAAAFRARFDHPAPPSAARVIHGAITGTSPARYRVFGHASARKLVAAAVVVLLVGSVAVALSDVGRLGGPSVPSDPTAIATTGASATPTEQALPGSVLDLPIINVSDAVIIALTSPVGAGALPVLVAVVDESGRLTGVTERGAVDPFTKSFDGRFGAYAEPGMPGRVHLSWVGGICDSQITVTVAPDIGSITFDMGPQPDCDSIGVGRQLVLDFDGSVDVPAIELRDVADAPTPVATSPPYQLDCGPLGPDACERRAASLVAALVKAFPTRRIESIEFRGTEQCVSHMVFFDDGTGIGANPTCIRRP